MKLWLIFLIFWIESSSDSTSFFNISETLANPFRLPKHNIFEVAINIVRSLIPVVMIFIVCFLISKTCQVTNSPIYYSLCLISKFQVECTIDNSWQYLYVRLDRQIRLYITSILILSLAGPHMTYHPEYHNNSRRI